MRRFGSKRDIRYARFPPKTGASHGVHGEQRAVLSSPTGHWRPEQVRSIIMDQRRVPANGWIWPLFGAAAGVLGAIGHLFTDADLTDEERASGAAVIDALDRTGFHIGIVSGLAAVFCLLIFTAGWRKWAATSAPE